MSIHRLSILMALVAVVCGASFLTTEVQAQVRWQQDIEVVAPVADTLVTGALLDSLVHFAQERGLRMRRDLDSEPISFSAAEADLLDEGLAFSSANRVFITYRLYSDGRDYWDEIQTLHFVYRPEGSTEIEDVPVFAVQGQDPLFQETINKSGIPDPLNPININLFRDQLMWHTLQGVTLTKLNNTIFRSQTLAEHEQRRLLSTIRQWLY